MPIWSSPHKNRCPFSEHEVVHLCSASSTQVPDEANDEEHTESSGQIWSICNGFFLNELETVEAILDGEQVYNQFTPCLKHLPIYQIAKKADDEIRNEQRAQTR